MKSKFLIIIGTRPEAIKMASLVIELRKNPKNEVLVCSTGQHGKMLDDVLDFFGINKDYDLKIMKSGQSLAELNGRLLLKIQIILKDVCPDAVFVHGDTTSALSGAMACFYGKIPVYHVEAGLRTNDINSPFPEEFNRLVISKLATKNFAPTLRAKKNLISEGIDEHKIIVTGNTVIDSLFLGLELVKEAGLHDGTDEKEKDLLLVTLHRRENHGEPLQNILKAIAEVAKCRPDVRVVMPVHPNPMVKNVVYDTLSQISNIELVGPLDYPKFIYYMQKAALIITDSGGIQEEAPSLGTPVIVTREKSERQEAIESGFVLLVGSDTELIKISALNILSDESYFKSIKKPIFPYGEGDSCLKILANL